MPTRILFSLLLLTFFLSARAGLVIQGSRIIYDEAKGEATVQMQYVGDSPTLLQVWMDDGEHIDTPDKGEVPFVMMPAVTRLDPGNGQTIRILRTRDELPKDRESVLYFNTLEVPPAPTEQVASGDAFMQFSIRGRFKFFYRPKGLPVASEKAIEMLRFSVAEALPDGRLQVRVQNTSPYHLTFSVVKLRTPGAAEDAEALLMFNHDSPAARMVVPMGELLLPLEWAALPEGAPVPADLEVDFTIINDGGGLQSRQQRAG